jgi:hypothetical protein
MRLSEVMDVYMPVYRGRENEHIMASHVERMKLSKCFTVTTQEAEKNNKGDLRPYKNALTCVTCHNPHVTVRKTGNAHFNNSCNNCHAAGKASTCTEQPEILALAQNDCVKCHMPSSGATDIPHVSVHDHFIRVPVKDETINSIKEFIGINCINNFQPDNESKGKAFIAYYEKFHYGKEVLDSARKYFPDNSPENIRKNFSSLVHIAFLENNYDQVIQYASATGNNPELLNRKSFDNSDAWTSYRIGESSLLKGDSKMAERFFFNAYKLAPLHPEFCNKYAYVLAMNGKHAEAKKILEASLEAYPKFPPVLSNLGYLVLLTEGDTLQSGKLYDQALALDPDYEQAIINKAGLYIATSRKTEARRILTDYLKRKPGSIKVKEILDQLTKSS